MNPKKMKLSKISCSSYTKLLALMQGSPEGTIQLQMTLLAKEALGQPELASSSDARLQAAFGQAGKGDLVQTGVLAYILCCLYTLLFRHHAITE